MTITINGQEIPAADGLSILDTALAAGIYIPHLCKHPDLEAVGGCRLCVVENEESGEVVPSCMTTVYDGMKIQVSSPAALAVRKLSMELILATHPADCTGCPKYGNCELQSMYQYMGVGPERWRKKTRTVQNDDSNPLISHLFTRCVRCGRCVRACRELRGADVLDFVKTKDGIRAGVPGGVSLADAGCRFCGACIEVCPTGSIMDAPGLIKEGVPYSDSVVPCRAACPAGTDVPRYVRLVKEGRYEEADAVIRERVPFPNTLGHICNHVCESVCKRGEINEPISICRLKRAAADAAVTAAWKERGIRLPATGKRVAVVGAGPAGLTAAYYLAKKGHLITVFEKNEKAGGQCRYGIPAYRLPDAVLDAEINDILEMGVELITGMTIKEPKELLAEGYDAVLVAVGAHSGNIIPIPGSELPGVLNSSSFLKNARTGKADTIGRSVVVLGGGNVAYDCARTALRLGATDVHIACLEAEGHMTASEEEIEQGRDEGIVTHNSVTFLRILGGEKATGVELQTVESFRFDENGKATLSLLENSQHSISADTVIFAVGQKPEGVSDMGLELVANAYIKVNEQQETNVEGIFGAGDSSTGTKSVIEAIAGGRRSAQAIDKYLGGDGYILELLTDPETVSPFIGCESDFAKRERHPANILDPVCRSKCFDEVERTWTAETAENEAARCLQCDLRLQLTKPKLWNEYERQG